MTRDIAVLFGIMVAWCLLVIWLNRDGGLQ